MPIVVTIVGTSLLVSFLQRQKSVRRTVLSEGRATQQRRERGAAMDDLTHCLIAIAVCFFVTIMPQTILIVIMYTSLYTCAFRKTIFITTAFAQLNSTVNFFIYFLETEVIQTNYSWLVWRQKNKWRVQAWGFHVFTGHWCSKNLAESQLWGLHNKRHGGGGHFSVSGCSPPAAERSCCVPGLENSLLYRCNSSLMESVIVFKLKYFLRGSKLVMLWMCLFCALGNLSHQCAERLYSRVLCRGNLPSGTPELSSQRCSLLFCDTQSHNSNPGCEIWIILLPGNTHTHTHTHTHTIWKLFFCATDLAIGPPHVQALGNSTSKPPCWPSLDPLSESSRTIWNRRNNRCHNLRCLSQQRSPRFCGNTVAGILLLRQKRINLNLPQVHRHLFWRHTKASTQRCWWILLSSPSEDTDKHGTHANAFCTCLCLFLPRLSLSQVLPQFTMLQKTYRKQPFQSLRVFLSWIDKFESTNFIAWTKWTRTPQLLSWRVQQDLRQKPMFHWPFCVKQISEMTSPTPVVQVSRRWWGRWAL